MASDQNANTKNIEEIFRHTLELNKKYMNQSFKMIRELGNQKTLDKNLFTFKPDLYSRTVHEFAKMNLEYYNKMMEFGFSVADQMLFNKGKEAEPEVEPSFTLTGEGAQGSEVKLQFVLENTKNEKVSCQLENTEFIDETDGKNAMGITTNFKPQRFSQEPGECHTVDILHTIDKKTVPGTYSSDVKVVGFEPSFFRIVLTVVPPTRKPSNANKRKRSQKKE